MALCCANGFRAFALFSGYGMGRGPLSRLLCFAAVRTC